MAVKGKIESVLVMNAETGTLENRFTGNDDECYDFILDNKISNYVITYAEVIQPKNWCSSKSWAKAQCDIHTYKQAIKEIEKLLNSGVIEKFNGKVHNVRFDKAVKEIGCGVRLAMYDQYSNLGGVYLERGNHKSFTVGQPNLVFRGSDTMEKLEWASYGSGHNVNINRNQKPTGEKCSGYPNCDEMKYLPMVNNEDRIIAENVITNLNDAIDTLNERIAKEKKNKAETKNQKKFDRIKKLQKEMETLYNELPNTFKEVERVRNYM